MSELLTLAEAAQRLGLTTRRVSQLAQSGLPHTGERWRGRRFPWPETKLFVDEMRATWRARQSAARRARPRVERPKAMRFCKNCDAIVTQKCKQLCDECAQRWIPSLRNKRLRILRPQAIAMSLEGRTDREIALALRMAAGTVQAWRLAAGLAKRKRGDPPKRLRLNKWKGADWRKQITCCPRGHEYTPENTVVRARVGRAGRKGVVRSCRKCETARRRSARACLRSNAATLRDRMILRHGRVKGEHRYRAYLDRCERRVRKLTETKVRPRPISATPALVARLLSEDPTSRSLARSAQEYRARYRYEPGFRERELKRRHQQKTARVIPDDGSLTGDVVRRMFAGARRCPACKRRIDPREKALDHIQPKSKGGAHSQFNTRILCRSCNSKKHAREPDQLVLA